VNQLLKSGKSRINRKIKSLEEEIRLLKSISKSVDEDKKNHDNPDILFDSMFESFYDGISISDMKANIIDVNQALVKMYGYESKEEVLELNAIELISEENHHLIQDYLQKIIQNGNLGGIELVCIRKNGSKFYVEISVSVINDSAGIPNKLIAITKDITERKQIEQKLNDNETFYRTLFELSPSGILLEDLEGNIIDINPAMAKTIGYPGEDLIGINVKTFSHPDREGEVEQHIQQLAGGERLEHSVKNQTRDGSISYLHLTERKVKIPGGREGILCVAKDVTELKKAEDALKQSVEDYKNLMSESPLAIEVLDKNGMLVQVNKAWEKLWNAKAEDSINKYNIFKNTKISKMGLMDYVNKAFNGENLDLPDVLYNPQKPGMSRRDRWLNIKVYALKDDYGKVKNVVIIVEDITNRKIAEEALIQSETRYKQIFEDSPVPLWEEDYSRVQNYLKGLKKEKGTSYLDFFDKNSDQLQKCAQLIKVINVNKAAIALYNAKKKEDLLGNIVKTFTPNSFEIFKYEAASIAAGVKNYQAEVNVKTLDGKIRAIHFTRNLGEKGMAIVATQDVTEIKTAELALRESEERFRTTFNQASDSIFLIEMTEKGALIRDANEAAQTSHGYSREELINKPITLFHDDSSPTRVPNRIEKALSGEHIVFETSDKRKDGSVFPIEVSARKILINGKPFIFSIERDISDRKKLEKQLQHSQKLEAIRTLAGGIAHDFNNILAAILGYSELTLDDVPTGSIAHDNLNAIMEAGLRAKELVEQILTFSRQKENELRPVKVNILVKEAVKFLQASIPSTTKLNESITPNCPMVMADPSQIHQIVMNLCTNAYQAIGNEDGFINIDLDKTMIAEDNSFGLPAGKYLKLVVQDSGKGIDKADYDKIFDPFFTTKNVGKGTGLGLSVVHGIISSLKGKISVSSPGKGSVFTVYLPTVAAFKKEIINKDKKVVGGNEKILLVEDDKMVSEMSKQLLESLGYSVTVENDSRSALKMFEKKNDLYDLVLTDQIMPKLTGINLALELLKLNKSIPIILMSGFVDSIDEEIVYDLGIKGYITKPVRKIEIGNLIRAILDNT